MRAQYLARRERGSQLTHHHEHVVSDSSFLEGTNGVPNSLVHHYHQRTVSAFHALLLYVYGCLLLRIESLTLDPQKWEFRNLFHSAQDIRQVLACLRLPPNVRSVARNIKREAH